MRKLLLVGVMIGVTTGALAQPSLSMHQTIEDPRKRFDDDIQRLTHAQDIAEQALNALSATANAAEIQTAKADFLEMTNVQQRIAQHLKDFGKAEPSNQNSAEHANYDAEAKREIGLAMPGLQRTALLTQKLLSKRPIASAAGTQIQHDDYPPLAMRLNHQGLVRYRAEYGQDGFLSNCTITSSSGFDELDAQTCILLKRRSHAQPQPPANTTAP